MDAILKWFSGLGHSALVSVFYTAYFAVVLFYVLHVRQLWLVHSRYRRPNNWYERRVRRLPYNVLWGVTTGIALALILALPFVANVVLP